MIASFAQRQLLPRAAAIAPLMLGVALSLGLGGCASSVSEIGDNMTLAFADPAKYDYYDCKLLETERKSLKSKIEDLERLMAKAQTGDRRSGGRRTRLSQRLHRLSRPAKTGREGLATQQLPRLAADARCHLSHGHPHTSDTRQGRAFIDEVRQRGLLIAASGDLRSMPAWAFARRLRKPLRSLAPQARQS